MSGNHTGRDYAALELRHRSEIIGGLRAAGLSYGDIARQLGIALSKVETCLGEAAVLRAQGLTKAEIAQAIGVPYGSLGRLLPARHQRLTARQNQVLAAVSDMHGMQVDVLAWFLDVDLSTAYDLAGVLIGRGYLQELTTVQPGRAWVYPKRDTAARYLGWRPRDWHPPITLANHYRAVAQARIMLVGADPGRWVSERVVRHRAEITAAAAKSGSRSGQLEFSTGREPSEGRPHVHDGWFHGEVDGRFGWWALEVELTSKDRAHLDLALRGAFRAAGTAAPHRMTGVLYLCRSAQVMDAVNAAHARLPAELTQLPLLFAVGDIDDEWTGWLAGRNQARAAKRRTRTGVHITKEAS
jgi:hypothetical protein